VSGGAPETQPRATLWAAPGDGSSTRRARAMEERLRRLREGLARLLEDGCGRAAGRGGGVGPMG